MIPERPRLRPYLQQVTTPQDPEAVYLVDRLGLSAPLALTHAEAGWLRYLDGQHRLEDIQRRVAAASVPGWLARLEHGLLLESPRFRQVADGPVRPPRCIGCYEGDPAALRRQLHGLFSRGAGLPRPTIPDGSLRAALVPHMDYARGGLCYTFGFREIVEKSAASLFVIIGTSHYSRRRFTLTRKNFQTPLGVAPTDQQYIDRLVKLVGPGVFEDEWLAHFPEHSIELEVVFLQYLYENIRPIRIVPLVVGSFHDCVLEQQTPRRRADIGAMIEALRRIEEQTQEPICYVISGDLAHIGPKFNDAEILDDHLLARSYYQDQELLRHAAAADGDGYFRVIAGERDCRNICGLPPTVTALEAVQPQRGELLCYDRYVHPQGYESVSFASMGFYR